MSKDIVENEGLIYIVGYVAHRFRHTHPNLGDPTRSVQIRNDWLSLISKGGCIYPTNEFIEIGKKMNIAFTKFHGNDLSREPYIFDKLTDIVLDEIKSDFPRKVIACLVRTRTYIRLKSLNIRIKNNNTVHKKSKKTYHLSSKIYV